MAAQLYTTGPAYLYVFTQINQAVEYLGTARVKPYIEIVPQFSSFFSDQTGRVVPADQSFDMEHGIVIADLNRIDWDVYEELSSAKFGGVSGSTPGYSDASMGTMIIAEGNAIGLFVVFPKSAVSQYASLPPGYHFPNCVFCGPDKFTDMGNSDASVTMTWRALNLRSVDNWTMYDYTGFGDLPTPT